MNAIVVLFSSLKYVISLMFFTQIYKIIIATSPIISAGQIANDVDMKNVVEDVITDLSVKIEDTFKRILS
ncbi:hypothetical protein GCM10027035_44340 [Emticicia sediminis]